MTDLSDFQVLLSEGIDDFTAHGYSSEEQLKNWLGQLRISADQSLPSDHAQMDVIREGLKKIFERSVRKAPKSHLNISVADIDRIAPYLRPVLDRRILSSADLIKLNRQQAIDMTLRRFSGWASSIPIGGTRKVKKRKVKAEISKPLRSANYETRRLLIDQGHKMAANINETIADQYGALGYTWRHVIPHAGYESRPEHLKRDGEVFLKRDSWAHKQGLVKKMGKWADEIDKPSEAVNCRCTAEYIYTLADLPEAALTKKGKEALKSTESIRS